MSFYFPYKEKVMLEVWSAYKKLTGSRQFSKLYMKTKHSAEFCSSFIVMQLNTRFFQFNLELRLSFY